MNNQIDVNRKRAIYTGLHSQLQGEQLMQAMVLWENYYAQQPSYALRFFLADLQRKVDADVDSKNLLLSLVSILNQPESKLLPDPSQRLEAYRRRMGLDSRAEVGQEEMEAFKMLVDKWLSLVEGPGGFDIVRFVSRSLDRLHIANDLRFNVTSWLDNKNHKMRVRKVNVSDLQRITNLFYVAFCEYLGPVTTDRLLSKALRQLKNNGGAVYADTFARLL